MGLTTDPTDPELHEVDEDTGMNKKYLVMSEEERSQGFVRPLRRSYRHVECIAPDHACHTVTTMGLALCETYARNPAYYSATFCTGCGKHLPVDQFVWVEDGEVVGS